MLKTVREVYIECFRSEEKKTTHSGMRAMGYIISGKVIERKVWLSWSLKDKLEFTRQKHESG